MKNPYEKVLQKASGKGSDLSRLSAIQRVMYKGFTNKSEGVKIVTDPTTTAKGNTTCQACITAKRTGAPLPPEHPNCRCSIKKI